MKQYSVIKKIGSGSFSDVYLVLEGSCPYAVKVFCKHTEHNINMGFYNDVSKDHMFFEIEKAILEKIKKTKNCLNPRGYINTRQLINYEKKDSLYRMKNLSLPCIVFDYYNTNLSDLISKIGFRFTDRMIRRFAWDFLFIIDDLARRKVYHSDIKPKNILLSLRKDNKIKYVLSDFTNSVILPKDSKKRNEYMTTSDVRSPERWNFADFSEKSEVYSLGCVLYYILSNGTMLFMYGNEEKTEWGLLNKKLEGETRKKIRKRLILQYENKIKEIQLRKRYNVETRLKELKMCDENEDVIDLLSKMLKYNKSERYDIYQCLNHPYFDVKRSLKKRRRKVKHNQNKKMRYEHEQIQNLTTQSLNEW